MKKIQYNIKDKHIILLLFSICFLIYFSTYLGRLNYSATMPAMLNDNIFTKTQDGIISTIFFFTYGIGQFVGGFSGDKFSPQKLVFMGIFMSSITNISMGFLNNYIYMAIFWSINGFFQAFIWSSMVKCILKYIDNSITPKMCLYLSISGPVGTILVYILTASIISIKSWQYVFIIIGSILLIVSILWLIVYNIVDNTAKSKGIEYIIEKTEKENIHYNKKEKFNWFGMLLASGFIFLLFCLIVQGALKNGVTSWVPVYIYETYNIGDDMSALSTVIIPIFNIFGVYFASLANKAFKDEIKSSALFFLLCTICLLVLYVFSGKNIYISLIMLAISTTTMTAVNTLLLTLLPIRFEKINRSASVYGILNSSVYIGTTISTYGIGSLSDDIGWTKTIMILVILSIISFVICLYIIKRWEAYKLKNL